MKAQKSSRALTVSAMIAAMYVVLSYVASILGLCSGVIQLRLSEALCVLPLFTPYAIPALTIGCLITNILFGGVIIDVIFGSVATLIGAVGTYLLRNTKHRILALIPPILSNSLIIPPILSYAYGSEESMLFMFITVMIGEILSVIVLGWGLIKVLNKIKFIFK